MKRLALAATFALIASGALAQTQPVPTAIAPGGQTMNSTPSAIIVAPAGGAGGKGTVVAPDHPLPVTGSFTLPSGAATAAKQDTGNTSAASIDSKLSTTNTTLGTLATSAAQTTGNTSLGSIDGKLSTTNTTLGTLATAAGQTTANASLASVAANTAPAGALTTVNRSLTLTTGGTAQTIMTANAARRSFYVFNPDASETLWCSVTGTAVANGAGSFGIGPTTTGSGGFGSDIAGPGSAVSCVAATTGHKITAWEVN